MSLKTRLRVAISLLMAAVVVALSLLYVHSFLLNEFERTLETAHSIVGQVQAGASARIELYLPPTATAQDRRAQLEKFVESDQGLRRILRRALENWPLISEVYFSEPGGRVLSSSTPANIGRERIAVTSVDAWKKASTFENALGVLSAREDVELTEPLAFPGDTQPVILAHATISMPFLRHTLAAPLKNLALIFAIALLVSIALAALLPNLFLGPIEALAKRLEALTEGQVPSEAGPRQSKEFAAVYSKLDVLGQRYIGARDNADQLRTNVQQLLERLERAVIMVDARGRLIMAGRNAARLLGADGADLSGKLLSDVVPPGSEVAGVLDDAVRNRTVVSDCIVELPASGPTRRLSIFTEPLASAGDARPLGMLITLSDPDAGGQIEAELGLAERLAALSRITRGVAHEIKNPLNAITLHLEVLRSRLAEPSPEVEVIASEIARLDRVVKMFLDFNRPVEPDFGLLDLNELAGGIVSLIRPQAGERKIQVELDTNGPAMVNGDPDLLKQAVLNVVMNALDAMPGGGTLTISVSRSNGFCVLAVADTGLGIPEEVQDRVFSLYFSTKQQGSGIGLALAYRFVQLHDGILEFSSKLGAGTTFRFSFPEAVSASRTANLVLSHSRGA